MNPPRRPAEILTLVCLAATGVILIALQVKPLGWIPLLVGVILLRWCERGFARDLLLVYISLALLGITSITTDVSYRHILAMGSMLIAAVAVPYLVSRFVFRDHHVRFPLHHGRRWFRSEIAYILITAALSFTVLPFYLQSTGAYLNWTVTPGTSNVVRLFLGTNGLGIWDELFFVCTCLGILRRYLSFGWANILQATLFTSFLFELGFTGWWGPIMIGAFALLQGIIFKRTESLLYVITIHLTMDLILFLALLNAHHPGWVPIFFT